MSPEEREAMEDVGTAIAVIGTLAVVIATGLLGCLLRGLL